MVTEILTQTSELADMMADPKLRIVDATLQVVRRPDGSVDTAFGRKSYEARHIPGAVFVDLDRDVVDPDAELRFSIPSEQKFAEAMERLGIGDDSRVVVYASTDPLWATRFWWLLRLFGFDKVSLLNGGLQRWIAEGRPLTDGPSPVPRAHFTPRAPDSRMIATRQSILASMPELGSEVMLVDTLSPDHYRGEPKISYGYPRPGHIAGAINVPSAQFVDPQTGCMLPASEIARTFDMALGEEDKPTIFYCGAGIAATLGAFAATLAGRRQVEVYDASLQEWAADPALPMEVGDEPWGNGRPRT